MAAYAHAGSSPHALMSWRAPSVVGDAGIGGANRQRRGATTTTTTTTQAVTSGGRRHPIRSRVPYFPAVGVTSPVRCVSASQAVSSSAADADLAKAQDAIRNSEVEVRASTVSGELRAAAATRAISFYTYPSDRSEFSVRAHRNMRIDAEWDAIGAKINGTDEAFKACRVACIVAAIPLGPDGEFPEGIDPSMVGVTLPAEELAGVLPRNQDPVPEGTDRTQDGAGTNALAPGETHDDDVDGGSSSSSTGGGGGSSSGGGGGIDGIDGSGGSGGDGGTSESTTTGGGSGRPLRYRRAYLSNVCVLPIARRTGLGRRMMAEAMNVASGWGVEQMYVHVVHDNVGAKTFYEEFGFVVESEESEAFAATLSRPRRLLLTQPCVPMDSSSRR